MTEFPSRTYIRNLRLLSNKTQELVDDLFTLATQVLFLKYKRKHRDYEETLVRRKKKSRKRKYVTGPLMLKEKDVSNSISLVDFHLNTVKEFDVSATRNLHKLFGNMKLEDALKYYDTYLGGVCIKDVMNRRIIFDANGQRFLYKEKTEEGKHVEAPENYVEARGKRLSWIEALLPKTREIYRQVESNWETFLYVGIFNITLKPGEILEEKKKNYFLIVTRKEKGKPLRFVTAYYMNSRLELLKHLEMARPLTIEQQKYISR